MIYNILPIIIIAVCLAIIISIIIKKFPELKALNVDSIPEERDAKVKEKIISNRVNRKTQAFFNKAAAFFFPIIGKIKENFRRLFQKVSELEKQYEKKESIFTEDDKKTIDLRVKELLAAAETFKEKSQLLDAEKKYIEIITLDSKNLDAYEGLAKIYLQKKEFDQAKETYIFLIKAAEKTKNFSPIKLAVFYFDLAEIFKNSDKMNKCFDLMKKVISLDTNNPKYIDFYLDCSIILKRKMDAMRALKHLKQINPENRKIVDFEKRIGEI